jgi:hypothetical protein
MNEPDDVVLEIDDGYIDIDQIFRRAFERLDLKKETLPDTDAGTEEEARDGQGSC